MPNPFKPMIVNERGELVSNPEYHAYTLGHMDALLEGLEDLKGIRESVDVKLKGEGVISA